MKKRIGIGILYAVAAVMLLYFVFLMIKVGANMTFHYVWLCGSLFLFSIALVLTFSKKGFSWLPKPVLYGMEIIILCGCILFVAVEAMIIGYSHREPKEEPDYLIVLGAQVRGTTPSLVLQYRIDKAAEYMLKHPDVVAIVSGGQGADEGISEALAMQEGMIAKGVGEERILLEDQSTSTKENLEFSKQYLDAEVNQVLVVTTDFHVLRAVGIAKKAGYQKVEGLSAKSVWYLIPSNYVREFMAVVKDKLVGNM